MRQIRDIFFEITPNPNLQLFINIANKWEKILGDFIAKHSRPIKINNGTLIIAVEDSIWMNEFTFMKSEFLERLHQYGYNEIKDLKFILKKIISKKAETYTPKDITPSMLHTADIIAAPIKDEKLKTVFKKAVISYLRNKR
ncbi:MAG: DUF721 domain-containing protein [Deferribacterales bacterium]